MSQSIFPESLDRFLVGRTPPEALADAINKMQAPLLGRQPTVRYYGARGDGETDDSGPFQDAYDAVADAGGGELFVGLGDFRLAAQVTPRSGVVLRGVGYGSHLILAVDDIGLGGDALTEVALEWLRITGASARALAFTSAIGLRIRSCAVSGATKLPAAGAASGLYLSGATDVWVEGCVFTGNGRGSGADASADVYCDTGTSERVHLVGNHCRSTAVHFNIAGFNLRDSEIRGNHCSGAVCPASNAGGYGILVYDSGGGVTIRNRVIDNAVGDTQGSGIYLADVLDSLVAANTIEDAALIQNDATLPVGGISVNGPNSARIVVTGNTVLTTERDGIVISGTPRATVTGNTVRDCAQAGIRLRGASDYATIQGNTVDLCGAGIQCSPGTVAGATIQGNTVTNTLTTGHGIDCAGTFNDGAIQGNTVTAAGGRGIWVAAGTRVSVHGNAVRSCSASGSGTYEGLRCDTTETVISGNTVSGANHGWALSCGSAGTKVLIAGNILGSFVTGGVDAPSLAIVKDNPGDTAATQTLVAGTAIVAADAVTPIQAASPITSTAAPTIADGQDGQRVTLVNVGANAITLQDQGTLASSNLRLTAATVAIGPRDSIELVYSAAVGDWVQTGNLVAVV